MQIGSIIAIYVLFWVFSVFIVLPFGVRNSHEVGEEIIAGQEQGAPANFRPAKVLIRTTIVATFLFGLFYANYVMGWLTVDMLAFSV